MLTGSAVADNHVLSCQSRSTFVGTNVHRSYTDE